jgi:hypothetical protein
MFSNNVPNISLTKTLAKIGNDEGAWLLEKFKDCNGSWLQKLRLIERVLKNDDGPWACYYRGVALYLLDCRNRESEMLLMKSYEAGWDF